MPSTAIDVGGAWGNAGKGFGSIFTAMAQAPLLRQRAEQEAALRAAQTYAANMQGNKYGADARGMEITNNYRTAPIDTSEPEWMQRAQKAFQWAASSNPDQIMSAMQRSHQMGLADAAIANPHMAPAIGQAQAASAGKQIYNNIGNTGAVVNPYTGGVRVVNQDMYGLHSAEALSRAQENRAQANAHNAQADSYTAQAALRENQTIGQMIANEMKEINLQRAQQGLPPVSASNGAAAAMARGRAQLIAAVINDDALTPEEKQATIERNMQLFDSFMHPNAPAAQQAAPLVAPQQTQAVTPTAQAYASQIASGGKPVAKVITRAELAERARKHGITLEMAAERLRAGGYQIQ